MTKMEKIRFLDDHKIEIVFTDGREKVFDMKTKLRTVRFHDLENIETFSLGILKNGQVICWDNGTELSIDEIISTPFHR